MRRSGTCSNCGRLGELRVDLCKNRCYQYLRKTGNSRPQTEERIQGRRPYPPIHERFWASVDKSLGHGPRGECWAWTACKSNGGYGHIYRDGKLTKAHRVSWELHNGPIPDGLYVCHHCDNKLCVNPEHLFVGTPSDNTRDAISKGLFVPPSFPQGEKHPTARLTTKAVLAIRARWPGTTQRALATEFGVGRSTISHLVRRNSWTHI